MPSHTNDLHLIQEIKDQIEIPNKKHIPSKTIRGGEFFQRHPTTKPLIRLHVEMCKWM